MLPLYAHTYTLLCSDGRANCNVITQVKYYHFNFRLNGIVNETQRKWKDKTVPTFAAVQAHIHTQSNWKYRKWAGERERERERLHNIPSISVHKYSTIHIFFFFREKERAREIKRYTSWYFSWDKNGIFVRPTELTICISLFLALCVCVCIRILNEFERLLFHSTPF